MCSPSGKDCSSVGPPRGHKPCQKIFSNVSSPLHRVTGPARSLLQHKFLIGSQTILGSSTCSDVGSSTGCRWISAPLWTSMGCRRTACLTMVFSMGCKRISAPAPLTPPSSLTLVFAELFFSHILTLLSNCWLFFPFLNVTTQRCYHCH